MKLVLISPPTEHPREREVLAGLFTAGLERFHLRKPAWSRQAHAAWLSAIPPAWRARMLLHFHQELAAEFGLAGVHWRDSRLHPPSAAPAPAPVTPAPRPLLTSRSCHDLPTLQRSLGKYDSVFFGPLYPSISKAGYGPDGELPAGAIAAVLESRTAAERRTSVLGLSGITLEHLPQVRALGFDGVAVIGAIWNAADPVRAFNEFQENLCCHAA